MLLRVAFVVLLASCSLAAKCATTGGGGTPPTSGDAGVVSKLLHCGTEAILQAASNLLGEVGNDLLTDGYGQALADLEAKLVAQGVVAAKDVVTCAVELFISTNARKAEADPLMRQQIVRAQAFIATR